MLALFIDTMQKSQSYKYATEDSEFDLADCIERLKKIGISEREVARRLEISQNALNKFKHGVTPLPQDREQQIKQVLKEIEQEIKDLNKTIKNIKL